MKRKNFIIKLFLFAFVINLASPMLAEESNQQTYSKEEIPQGLQDLRRFEIITLGALPFVVLDSTLVYSGIKYIQNDFSSQYTPGFNQSFTKDEQKGIILTSLGICVGIGITDLIVNLVKRNKKKKSQENYNNSIIITPISQDPEAIKLEKPETFGNKEEKKSIENTKENN